MVSSSKAFNVLSKASNVTFGPVSYHNLTPQILKPDNNVPETKPKIGQASTGGVSGATISSSLVRKSTSSTFGSFGPGDSRAKFPKNVHRTQAKRVLKSKIPSVPSTSSDTSALPVSSTTTPSSQQSPPNKNDKPNASSTSMRSILRSSTRSTSTSIAGSTSGSTAGSTFGQTGTASTNEASTSKTTEETNDTIGTEATEANNCSTTSSDWQFGKKLPRAKNPPSTTTATTDSTAVTRSNKSHKREEKNVLCIFRENQTLAIGLYFWQDHIIRWNESVLSFSDMEFITDHILLPLLIRYSPGYLVVCGKQEDIILDHISKIDPRAVKRIGYKPPILKRLVSIDFSKEVAMHTLKHLQDGKMATRLILPADALQAIKCLGGLVKFLNLSSQESKTISFEKLKVNAILSINKSILKQLNIIPGDRATKTPSLFTLLRTVVCKSPYK